MVRTQTGGLASRDKQSGPRGLRPFRGMTRVSAGNVTRLDKVRRLQQSGCNKFWRERGEEALAQLGVFPRRPLPGKLRANGERLDFIQLVLKRRISTVNCPILQFSPKWPCWHSSWTLGSLPSDGRPEEPGLGRLALKLCRMTPAPLWGLRYRTRWKQLQERTRVHSLRAIA